MENRVCNLTCPGCPKTNNQARSLLAHPFFPFGICRVCIEFHVDRGRQIRRLPKEHRAHLEWPDRCRVCGKGGELYECGSTGCEQGVCKACANWYPDDITEACGARGDCDPARIVDGIWRCPQCVSNNGSTSALCHTILAQQCYDVTKTTFGTSSLHKGWPQWVKPRGSVQGKVAVKWEEATVAEIRTPKKLCLAFNHSPDPYFKMSCSANVRRSHKHLRSTSLEPQAIIPATSPRGGGTSRKRPVSGGGASSTRPGTVERRSRKLSRSTFAKPRDHGGDASKWQPLSGGGASNSKQGTAQRLYYESLTFALTRGHLSDGVPLKEHCIQQLLRCHCPGPGSSRPQSRGCQHGRRQNDQRTPPRSCYRRNWPQCHRERRCCTD